MGLEINKYDGRNTPQELIDLYKVKSEINEGVRKTAQAKSEKEEDSVDPDKNLDTYKKNLVSNTIEQQIKEQQAKIDRISKDLEVLKAEYIEAEEKEEAARIERRIKARELYQKEVSEGSLKRIFENWRRKYMADKTNEELEGEYNTSNLDYDSAMEARIKADKDYDLSDTEAYSAIMASNRADIDFLGGLWNKRDAYWDLAKMQQRLGLARAMESRYNS